MFKPYGRKKRLKVMLLIISLIVTVIYCASIYSSGYYTKSKLIAEVGSEKIYENDIVKKYNSIIYINNDKVNNISKLPSSLVQSIVKEIYVERILLAKAKKTGIQRKDKTKERIRDAINKIILEDYTDKIIKEATSEEKIKNKYQELVKNAKNIQLVNFDAIILNNKKTADIIFNKLTAQKQPSLARFNYFKRKYSTKKHKRQYKAENELEFKYIKKGFYKSYGDSEFKIFLALDTKNQTIPELNNELKAEIKYQIYQEVMTQIIDKALKGKTINIIR